jgi:hypothetical protein
MGKNKYVVFLPALSLIYGLEIKFFCLKWTVNYEQSETAKSVCLLFGWKFVSLIGSYKL